MLTYASSAIKVPALQIHHEKDHTISSGRFQRISLLADDVAGFWEQPFTGNWCSQDTEVRACSSCDARKSLCMFGPPGERWWRLSDFGLAQLALNTFFCSTYVGLLHCSHVAKRLLSLLSKVAAIIVATLNQLLNSVWIWVEFKG